MGQDHSLHHSIEDNDKKNIKKILSKISNTNRSISFNRLNLNYLGPIHIIARQNDKNTLKMLLNSNKPLHINLRTNQGRTALHWSVISNSYDVFKILINLDKCQLDVIDNFGKTPLHYSINKNIKFEKMLLKFGAKYDIMDNFGFYPIDLAFQINNNKKVSLLIDKNPKFINNNGNTILHLSVLNNNLQICKYIFKNNYANIYISNNKGESALDIAFKNKFNNIIKLLLADNPLEQAVYYDNTDIVTDLISDNTNINNVNKDGDNLLHVASKRSSRRVAKLLIEHGVNKYKRNSCNMTPVDLAKSSRTWTTIKSEMMYDIYKLFIIAKTKEQDENCYIKFVPTEILIIILKFIY